MKTFKDNLIIAEHEELDVYKLLVAYEVEHAGIVDKDDDRFEEVCKYVYDWITTSGMRTDELCKILYDGIFEGAITIDHIIGDYDIVKEFVEYRM